MVFCSRMPSSCCHTRKHFAVTLLNSSFTLSGIIKMTTVEGAYGRSLFRGTFLWCEWICNELLPKLACFIDPPFYFISAVFCCSNSFNSHNKSDSLVRRMAQNSRATVRILCIIFIAFINMLMYDSCFFFFFPSPAT